MPELVGSMSFGQSKVTTELLKAIGYKKEVELLTDEFKNKLLNDKTQCILLYRPLAATLQFAVDQAKDFEAVIQEWIQQATLLLSLVKSHRQHVFLFNEKDLSLNPQSFVEHIHGKGLLKALPEPYSESIVNAASSFSQYISSELKRRDPVLNRLENQLLALSQPLVHEVEQDHIDPLRLLNDYQQLKSKRDQLNHESKILKNNNGEISSRLEAAEMSVTSLKKRLAEQSLTSEKASTALEAANKKYLSLAQQQVQLEKCLAAKSERVNEFEKSDKSLRQQIASFESAIKEHEKSISLYKAQLDVKFKTINALEAEKSELTQQLANTVKAKDTELAVLMDSLGVVKSELRAKHKDLETLESEKSLLSQHLESTLESKDKELAVLAGTLDSVQAELNANVELIKVLTADRDVLALRLAEVEEVSALNLTNLRAERDTLEQTFLQVTTEVQEKQVKIDELNRQLWRLNKDCLEGKNESRMLLEQLHYVQEVLESKMHEHHQVLADKEQMNIELSDVLARQVQAFEQVNVQKTEVEFCLSEALSDSKQKQSDLNASAQTLLAISAELKNVKAENNLFLEQLHLVQGKLELQYLDSLRLKDESQQLIEVISALEEQLTDATEAWSVSDHSAARLGTDVLSLQKEKAAWHVEKQRLLEEVGQLSTLKDQNDQQQIQCHELSLVVKELGQEKQTLLERIAIMSQSALDAPKKNLQDLERAFSQEENKVLELQAKVVESSVNAQHEAKSEIAESMCSLAELHKKSSLLVEQLHFTQEELERYFVKYRDAGQQESHLLACFPSLLFALRKYPYTSLLKTQHTQILRHVFDEKWYLSTYLDVAKSPAAAKAPFMHFLHHGFFEGRNPRADLETLAFVQSNPEALSGPQHPVLSWAEYLNQP